MPNLQTSLLRHFGLELNRRSRVSVLWKPVHYLHIGKTAGTQIGNVIRQANKHQIALKIIKHTHDTPLCRLPGDEAYFFSVRDPVARFKSGFYSRKRMGRPRFDLPWNRDEQSLFGTFEHANDLAEALFSDGLLGRQALAGLLSVGHLGDAQLDWFKRAGDIFTVRQPVWIVRQHRLLDDLTTLLRRLKIDMPVHLTDDPKKSHVYDYEGVPELSPKAVENLQQWFLADYVFLKHCEEWLAAQEGGLP